MMIRKLLIPILAVLLLVASVSAASLVSLEDVVSTGEVSSYCGAVDPSNIDSCNHDTQTTPRDSSSISIPDSFFDALGNHSRDRKGCLDVNVFTSDPDDVYSSLKASSLAMWYNHRGVDCMGFQQDNDKMLCSYPLFLLNDENELFSVHSLLSDLDDRYSPRSTPYSSGCDDFSFSSTSSAKDFMFNLVDDVDDNHLDGVAEVSSRYLPNRNRTFSSGHRYIDQWSDYSMIIVSEDESSSAIRASYLSSLLNVPFFVKSHDNISMVRSLADDKDVIVVSSTPVFIQRMKRLFGEDLSPSYPSLDTAFLVSGSRLADFEHRILSRLYDDADSGNVSASRDDDYIEGHTQDAIKNDDYIHQVPLDREISSSNKLVVYNSHDLSKGRDVVGKTELTGGSFETTGVNAHDVVSENASLFYGEPLLAPYLGVAHGQRLLDLNTEDFISDTRITTFDSFAAFSSFNEHFSVDDRSFSSEAARSNARIRSKEQDIERPSDSTYFTFLSSPDSFPYSFDSNTSVPSEVYIALEDNSLGVDVDDLLSRPVHAGWLFSPSVSLTSLMTMQNLFFAPPGFEDTRSGYRMNIEYEPTVSHQRNDPYTVGFSSGDPEYANRVAFQDDALKHDDLFSADYIPVTTHIDRDLLYRPDRQADSIDIEGLQFFTAQTDLWPTPSTENALDKLIAFFRSNPGVDVTLIAHADHRRLNPSTDSFENNIELSQARAEAIKDVIESYAKDHPSIDLGTIDTEGRGATEPRVVDTSTYPYLASYDDDGDGSVTLGESFFNTHDLPDTVRRRALSLNRRVELHVDDSPSYDRGASRKTISDNRSYPDPFYNLLYHQVSFSSDDFLSFPFDNEDLDFVSPSYFSSMVVDSPYFGYEHRLDSGEFSFAWLLFKKGVRSVYSFDRGTSPSDNADYFAQTLVTSKRDGLLQGALPHNMFDVYAKNHYPEKCVSDSSSCSLDSFSDRAMNSFVKRFRLIGDPLSMLVPPRNELSEDDDAGVRFISSKLPIVDSSFVDLYESNTGSSVSVSDVDAVKETFLKEGETDYSYLSRQLPVAEKDTVTITSIIASDKEISSSLALYPSGESGAVQSRQKVPVKSVDGSCSAVDRSSLPGVLPSSSNDTLYSCSYELTLPSIDIPFKDYALEFRAWHRFAEDGFVAVDERYIRLFSDNRDQKDSLHRLSPAGADGAFIDDGDLVFSLDLDTLAPDDEYSSIMASEIAAKEMTGTQYPQVPLSLSDMNLTVLVQSPLYGGCLHSFPVKESHISSSASGGTPCASNPDYQPGTDPELESQFSSICSSQTASSLTFRVPLEEVFSAEHEAVSEFDPIDLISSPVAFSFSLDIPFYELSSGSFNQRRHQVVRLSENDDREDLVCNAFDSVSAIQYDEEYGSTTVLPSHASPSIYAPAVSVLSTPIASENNIFY